MQAVSLSGKTFETVAIHRVAESFFGYMYEECTAGIFAAFDVIDYPIGIDKKRLLTRKKGLYPAL